MDAATLSRKMTARRVLFILTVVLGVIGMHSLIACMGAADMAHSSASQPADLMPADLMSPSSAPADLMPSGSMPADHHSHDRSCMDHCVGIVMTIAQIAAVVLTLIAALLVVAAAYSTPPKPTTHKRTSGTSPPWTTLTLTQLSLLRI